jgi:hypothetical protein
LLLGFSFEQLLVGRDHPIVYLALEPLAKARASQQDPHDRIGDPGRIVLLRKVVEPQPLVGPMVGHEGHAHRAIDCIAKDLVRRQAQEDLGLGVAQGGVPHQALGQLVQ